MLYWGVIRSIRQQLQACDVESGDWAYVWREGDSSVPRFAQLFFLSLPPCSSSCTRIRSTHRYVSLDFVHSLAISVRDTKSLVRAERARLEPVRQVVHGATFRTWIVANALPSKRDAPASPFTFVPRFGFWSRLLVRIVRKGWKL